jgi:uncharacterized protein YodC (DUF2158 family)
MSFDIGDKVRLKSGGAAMVVEKIDGEDVHCVWQREGETKRDNYIAAVLEKVTPGPASAMPTRQR